MSTDFTIEFRLTYLSVQHTQDFTPTVEVMNQFWPALSAACKSFDCKQVIWEGKIAERRMTTTQIYDSASQAGQVATGLRLACVFENYTPDERTVFFKTVASRKGVSVEFFSHREEALAWLGVDLAPSANHQLIA